MFVGQFIDWSNRRLPNKEKVFTIDFFKNIKPNYLLMVINAIIYIILLYFYGIKNNYTDNINLYKFLILSPMLISAFCIDMKHHIIPNRLNLTIFEVGLIFTIIGGISDINFAINSIEGLMLGGIVFLIITLIGGVIAGKEAMGFGDVKFISALGLYFGFANMLSIIFMSFFLGAILSIILIIFKLKKSNEYIAFGPFIVIASYISIFVQLDSLINVLIKIIH
jgi:leader peptidase (prepilin peptidase)/N-methyltransferase